MLFSFWPNRKRSRDKSRFVSDPQESPPFDPLTISPELKKWLNDADKAARSLAKFGPDVIDDLIPLLSPIDSYSRIPAITTLKEIGTPAIPRLIELLAHKDRAVAVSASVAMNRMGTPAVPSLSKALKSENDQVVDQAANALLWIGPGANSSLPDLFAVVGSEKRSDTLRVAAARAAAKIDPTGCRKSKAMLAAIPLMIRVLEKGIAEHQGWAAEALGGMGGAASSALPLLRKRINSSEIQWMAKEAIAAIEKDSK